MVAATTVEAPDWLPSTGRKPEFGGVRGVTCPLAES
jgi:hypothetical protein